MSKLTELTLSNKPKLIISKELQSEIMCLHARIGDVEWSGPVFYKIMEGNINDPDKLVIKALHVFPCDVGTGTYTEYTLDEKVIDFYDVHPECDPTVTKKIKWAHCHSHHNMECFFSGTDMAELHDNAGGHNYYLSLIVNHKSKFCAKIALVAERTIKSSKSEDFITFNGSTGVDKINLISEDEKDSTEKVLVLLDCNIEFEQDDFFKSRIDEITKPKVYKHSHVNYPKSSIGFKQTNMFGWDGYNYGDDYYEWMYDKYKKHPKPITTNDHSIHNDLDSLKVKTFLVKWLSRDYTCEDRLSDVLKEVNKTTRGKVLDGWLNDIDRDIKAVYGNVFDKDWTSVTDAEVEKLAIACCSELRKYSAAYNIAQDIIELLDLYIVEEEQDFIVNEQSWNRLQK